MSVLYVMVRLDAPLVVLIFLYCDGLNNRAFSSVKALAGLQFLLNRAQALQENGSKFSLSG